MNADPFELIASVAPAFKRLDSDKAKCKAVPEQRHQTVSVARGADGRVLVTDFAGRSVDELCAGWGIKVADLFPPRPRDLTGPERAQIRATAQQARWAAALRVIATESLVVLVASRELEAGAALNSEDQGRLSQAVRRIQSARELLA